LGGGIPAWIPSPTYVLIQVRPAANRPEPLVVLSHLVHRLLKREGGSVPLERVTLRVSDYADIGDQEAADLIDTGAAEGIFTLDRGAGGSTTIVGVSP
jgi:nitric oxide reductase NorQ protein